MMKKQVNDKPELLNLMMEDSERSPKNYQLTNFWGTYAKKLVPELLEFGLKDFRRRKKSILTSFGATDLSPRWIIDISKISIFKTYFAQRFPFYKKLCYIANLIINKLVHVSPSYIKYIKKTPYLYAKIQGEIAGSKSIVEFDSSLIGNPEDIVKIGSKVYTRKILFDYLRYVYCSKHIDFNNIKTFVELGCGSGRQIEVIKKLFPDICFFLFDIPPQLYVCEQYLSSVFPNSVISYEKTRNMETIPKVQKGKIYIFGNWKFPILEHLEIDLFWNAASFSEMEPDVVSNYLSYVNRNAKNIYLLERMDGKEIAKDIGSYGVIKQTKFSDYKNALKDFQLVDMISRIEPERTFFVNPLLIKITTKFKNLMKYIPFYCYFYRKQKTSPKGYKESFWIPK